MMDYMLPDGLVKNKKHNNYNNISCMIYLSAYINNCRNFAVSYIKYLFDILTTSINKL